MSRFNRKPPVKQPASTIIVVTEGKKTEPQYLEVFKEIHVQPHVKRSVFNLEIISGIGVPMTVVNRAIHELQRLQRLSNGKNAVWAMFDLDEHPHFKEAKRKARRKGVHLAVSNPCFEIWGIYHYQDWQGPIERDQCQRKLEELCSSYDRNSGKTFVNEDIIKNKCHDAIERAERSLNSREKEGNPEGDPSEGNPSTSVHCLIKEILSKVEELKSQAIESP